MLGERLIEMSKIADKQQDEIERLKDQLNEEIEEELKQSEIMVKKQQEIERLNNIIKEVREYIEDLYDVRFTDKDKRKILEILDKE